ncbi:hypothetical protein HanPSC8_Chr11g0452051 [Helianthus annuus]|nr:hypothetical protein HanPSC8_Chr11g0452051 [Helianthus annuus]
MDQRLVKSARVEMHMIYPNEAIMEVHSEECSRNCSIIQHGFLHRTCDR